LVFDKCVQGDQQLAEAGDKGDEFGFAAGDELLVVAFDVGVVSAGGEGGHVEDVADDGPAAEDGPAAAHQATVAVDGGDANQGGDGLAVDGAQFGQEGQEGSGGDVADAWDAGEQGDFVLPDGAVADALIEIVVDVGDLGAQE
jgi:hypothetical protein